MPPRGAPDGRITLAITGEVSRIDASTEAGPVELVVPDDRYDVDARTTLGRTDVQVRTDGAADRQIRVRSEIGSVTVRSPGRTASGSQEP